MSYFNFQVRFPSSLDLGSCLSRIITGWGSTSGVSTTFYFESSTLSLSLTFTPLQVGFFFRSPYQFLFNKLAVCLCKPSDVFYFFITFKVWASHVPPMNNLRLLAKPIWLMADLWGFVLGHCPSPNEPRSWHELLRSQFLSQLSQFSLKYFSDLFLFSSFSCFLLPSDRLFAVLSDPSPLVCLIAPLFITSSAGWLKHSPIWFLPCKPCFLRRNVHQLCAAQKIFVGTKK